MKKLLTLLLLISLTFSCSKDLQFSTPSFQGTKDYVFWKSNDFRAILNTDGSVKIIGTSNADVLSLNLSGLNLGLYNLANTTSRSAVYETAINGISTIYSTINGGDGEIVIQEYNQEEQTISGIFKFNAKSSNGTIVNFINGVFYQIPLESTVDVLLGSNSFNASVNSFQQEASSIDINYDLGSIDVKGMFNDGTSIDIIMPDNIQIGNYSLTSQAATTSIYSFSTGDSTSSQYGTLTIIEHDTQFNRIKGSFSFETGNPHNISVSGGNFNIFY